MANPHLIQALYGPKPTVPKVNNISANARSPSPQPATPKVGAGKIGHDHALASLEASSSRASPFDSIRDGVSITSRSLSLAERLYGSTAESKPNTQDKIHPDRLGNNVASDSEITDDESPMFSEPWAPTGPNKMSVAVSPVVREMSKSSAPAEQASAIVPPAASRSGLRLSVERYLPPRGPYYDQFSLQDTFDFGFTVNDCSTCWGPKSMCPRANTCTKTCKVCGTKNHPGQTCPSLYCTISWYNDRRIEPYASWFKGAGAKPFALQYVRQFRPSEKDFPVLSQLGMILGTFKQGSRIVPNMAHPRVKTFYRTETSQADVQSKPVAKHLASNTDLDRVSLMRSPTPTTSTLKADVQKTATLDPRLQGKFAYMTMSKTSSPAPSGSVSSTVPTETSTPVMDGYTKVEEATEQRLQELEDEVIKLKMENVQKDREIRRLKTENMRLSGMNDEPGLKRQRT